MAFRAKKCANLQNFKYEKKERVGGEAIDYSKKDPIIFYPYIFKKIRILTQNLKIKIKISTINR